MTTIRRFAALFGCLMALLVASPGGAVADPTSSPQPSPAPSIPPVDGQNPVGRICKAVPGGAVIVPGCQAAESAGDCKPAPPVTGPLTNMFADWPGMEPQHLPPAADPFAPGSATSVFEQYGLGSLRWSTYDLGCGGTARDPGDSMYNGLANFALLPAMGMVAGTGSILYAAYHPQTWAGPSLDNVVEWGENLVYHRFFLVLIAPMLLLISLLVAWKATGSPTFRPGTRGPEQFRAIPRGEATSNPVSLTESTRITGWALLMVLVTMLLTGYPIKAAHGYDYLVSNAMALSNAPFTDNSDNASPAWTAAIGNLHRAVLYTTWQRGEVGTSDDQTRRLVDRLYADQSLTWRERMLPDDQLDALIKHKEQDFKATAAYIQKHDPSAYDELTGKHALNRLGWALLADILAVIACLFMAVAGLIVLIALVSVRLAIMVAPVLCLIGAHPRWSRYVIAVAGFLGTQLGNLLRFGIGAAVYVMLTGFLLGPDSALPPIIALLLLGVLTVVAFRILHPFRAVWQALPGSQSSYHEYRKHLGDQWSNSKNTGLSDRWSNTANTGIKDVAQQRYATVKGRLAKTFSAARDVGTHSAFNSLTGMTPEERARFLHHRVPGFAGQQNAAPTATATPATAAEPTAPETPRRTPTSAVATVTRPATDTGWQRYGSATDEPPVRVDAGDPRHQILRPGPDGTYRPWDGSREGN